MAVDDVQKHLGIRVRAFRRSRQLSQEALAAAIGTSKETVSNIERGLTWPRPKTIEVIATTLGVGIAELFGDPLPPKREHALIEEIIAILSDRSDDELQAVIDQTRVLLRISRRKT